MMRIIWSQDHARAFPASDAQYDRRDAARNGIRLPYQERIWLKKLDQRMRKEEEEGRGDEMERCGGHSQCRNDDR